MLYLELLINKIWVTTIFPSDWARIVNNAIPDGPAIKLVLKRDSRVEKIDKMGKEQTEFDTDPCYVND